MPKINIKNYVTVMKLCTYNQTLIIDNLLRHGILRISDLMAADEETISKIPYIKNKNLEALKRWMTKWEMGFGMSESEIQSYEAAYWGGDR